jgi:hypothetical protein
MRSFTDSTGLRTERMSHMGREDLAISQLGIGASIRGVYRASARTACRASRTSRTTGKEE